MHVNPCSTAITFFGTNSLQLVQDIFCTISSLTAVSYSVWLCGVVFTSNRYFYICTQRHQYTQCPCWFFILERQIMCVVFSNYIYNTSIYPHFEPLTSFCLGLGWPWVGEFVGFIIISTLEYKFPNPTEIGKLQNTPPVWSNKQISREIQSAYQ